MGCVFIGHLTKDEIEYGGNRKAGLLGGASLYSSLGYAIWSNGAVMVSVMGKNYDKEQLQVICRSKKINISNIIIDNDNMGIDLLIKYNSKNNHEFIKKLGSGDYLQFAPKSSQMEGDLLKNNSAYHITPIPIIAQLEIAKKIKKHNDDNFISVDPDVIDLEPEKRDEWMQLLKLIDCLVLNQTEWRYFLNNIARKNDVYGLDDLGIKCIQDMFGIKRIIIKCANRGVIAIDNEKYIYRMLAFEQNCIDSTGAGDAFAGGVSYALEQKLPFSEALKYGVISASYAIANFGISGLLEVSQENAEYKLMTYKRMIKGEKNIYYN